MESEISKESKEQLRYRNSENLHGINIESIDQEYSKWVDDSIVINLESPQADEESVKESLGFLSPKKSSYEIFTVEYIKSLPEFVVKNIILIRSDCFDESARETKLIAKNRSYKAKIKELKTEMQRILEETREIIEEHKKSTAKAIKSSVKPLKVEVKLLRTEREKTEDLLNSQQEEIEKFKELYIKTLDLYENAANSIESQQKELEKYSEICDIDLIPSTKSKLQEHNLLKQQCADLKKRLKRSKTSNKSLESACEVLNSEVKKKSNEIGMLQIELISLKESLDAGQKNVETLNKVIQENERMHKDLAHNFKMLEDELNQMVRPKKIFEKGYSYEIERLKAALAENLMKKQNK